jgi:hypothetical protein
MLQPMIGKPNFLAPGGPTMGLGTMNPGLYFSLERSRGSVTRVMIILSPVLWLVLSVAFHGYLARCDDEADVVVPVMCGAFFAVLACG